MAGMVTATEGEGLKHAPAPARTCPFCTEANVSPYHIASHLRRILPATVMDINSGESSLSVPSFSSTPKWKVPSDPPDELNRRLEALMQKIQPDETVEALVQEMHSDEAGGSHVQTAPSDLGDGTESAANEEEEEEGGGSPGLGGDAAQTETENVRWPNWLVADVALAIRKALKPQRVTDRAPFLRFLPLMDHDAILSLRAEYKRIVQIRGKGVIVAKHIRLKLGTGHFKDACYVTALGQWESEVFWITAFFRQPWPEPDYTDIKFLLTSLLDRDNNAILAIKATFKSKKYGEDLSQFVESKLRDETLRLVFRVVLGRTGGVNSDSRTVEEDIAYFSDHLRQGRWNLTMTSILFDRARPHLRSLWQGLKDWYALDLVQEAQRYHYRAEARALAYVIEGAVNRPLRDASMLCDAIGNGQERLLTAYLVRLHWNPRSFVAVKAEFRQQYGRSVEEAIAEKFPPTSECPNLDDWRDFCIELAMSTDENSRCNPPSDTLHVGNIPPDASYEELLTLFRAQPGYKGFGLAEGTIRFVKFEDARTASKALNDLTGCRLSNSGKIGIRLNFANSAAAARWDHILALDTSYATEG
ncbi:hypothetical protein BJX65DRAFT_314965 [Aspergillus insuetus]